jgi:carboxymethylenebutenolidase
VVYFPAKPSHQPKEATMPHADLIAQHVTVQGDGGDQIEAYYARPLGDGPFPGIAVIHHMPGFDEWTHEVVRKLAHHGYAAISAHLFYRHGPGEPDDLAAKGRAAGGLIDSQVMGDVAGSIAFLKAQPEHSGKIGIIGFCSGGRHVMIAAAQLEGVDAAVDCWGGGVVQPELTPQRPVAPIDMTPQVRAPILGIFGNEDANPSPEQVDQHEEELKKHGKAYEFHRYDGAGHAFFAWYRPNYRQDQATDAWGKVLDFYAKHLSPASVGAASS